MEILYVSGLFMPASGGAERSMRTILRDLAALGHRVTVVTGPNAASAPHDDAADPGIEVVRLDSPSILDGALECICDSTHVDLLITQSSWCDRALLFARRWRITSIYFLRSAFGEFNVSRGGRYSPDFVFANSPAVAEYLRDKWGREDVHIVPPTVDVRDYTALHNTMEYITIVNPVAVKGGYVFKAIARLMPDRRFLAVKGWGHLRHEDQWDQKALNDLAAGFGVAPFTPEDVTFEDTPNVRIEPSVDDMRRVYGRTRLLLVPSLVPEGGPRVAIEAMINGIPVLGSPLGATPSTIACGGDVVAAYEDPNAWIETIRLYDDAIYYADRSRGARERAGQVDRITAIQPLLQVLDTLQRRNA
jgi:glycosyltransferase involved in cell wall biosynthesis